MVVHISCAIDGMGGGGGYVEVHLRTGLCAKCAWWRAAARRARGRTPLGRYSLKG